MLAWLAALIVAGQMLFGAIWIDHLAPAQGPALLAFFAAFIAKTFWFHSGAAMAVATLFALAARRMRLALLTALLAGVGLGPDLVRLPQALVPRATIVMSISEIPREQRLTIASANLLYSRADPEQFLSWLSEADVDVLVIQEWTPKAQQTLAPRLRERWPHAAESPRDDAFGQAVFSKRPFLQPARLYPPDAGFSEPQISFAVDLAGRALRITNVHLLPPVRLNLFAEQRRSAAALSRWAAAAAPDSPHILAGDFNAAPGSGTIKALTRQQFQLANAVRGGLRSATWPDTGPLRFAPGVAIDHIIASPLLQVLDARVGPSIGSDHRPIVATVSWRPL